MSNIGSARGMCTKHMLKLIATIAVTLTIAALGIVSASPPVPPPNQTSLVETTVDIECHGTVTEDESFEWIYTTHDLSDNNLSLFEHLAQIQYEENMDAVEGFTQFTKGFTADGQNAPNLAVDMRIGYVGDDSSSISWLDNTENVGMQIVTEGYGGSGWWMLFPGWQRIPLGNPNSVGAGLRFEYVDGRGDDCAALCPWAQGVFIPPTNELVSAGSQLEMVDIVSATTKTSVTTTESPRLHHEIDATGIAGYGEYVNSVLGGAGARDGPYGVGTASAGMKVSAMEGANYEAWLRFEYPLASTLTYDEMTTANGRWDFSKVMTYEAQIPEVNIPRQYHVFHQPA